MTDEKCPACEGRPSRFYPDPCPVCGHVGKGRLRHRVAMLLAAAAFWLSSCDEHEPRPCERLQHHTVTGHVVLCDCTCGDDPRFACPDDAVCDADIEDGDWRWPDAG